MRDDVISYTILPIKPEDNLKEIEKKVRKKIFFKYHPDRVNSVKPKELQKEITE